jgi:hypothetical protein
LPEKNGVNLSVINIRLNVHANAWRHVCWCSVPYVIYLDMICAYFWSLIGVGLGPVFLYCFSSFVFYSFFFEKEVGKIEGWKVYRSRVMKIIYVDVYSEMSGGIPRKYDLVGHLRYIGNGDEKRDRLHY